MRSLLVTLIVCLLVSFCTPVSAESWIGDTVYPKIKTPHPYPRGEAGQLVWTHRIHQKGAAWIKPHFNDFKINDEDYIELVDMYGNVIETIQGVEINESALLKKGKYRIRQAANNKRAFWGPAIDGDELEIRLYRGSDKRKGYGFNIDEVGVGAAPIIDDGVVGAQSICGSNDLVDIKCKSSFYQNLGKSVGRMLYQKSGSWYVCTGFLVSCNSSHFLTNEHCITSQSTVDTLQVRFKYRYTSCGGSSLDSYSTYYGDDFVTDNSYYDFCLLTLTGSPQNSYGYLKLINGNPISNESIYIIQHPGGVPQKFEDGTVYSTSAYSGRDFSYYVDTQGGSSGSPVFAETEDEVLGLHHYGGCPNTAVKMNHIYEYIDQYLGCN